MAADPYVPPELDDVPRQVQNLAPGVSMPAARPWVANRPGDDVFYGQPRGRLFGSPGPNVGYARLLAQRLADRVALAPGERLEDALAVAAEVAMKRAASFGRAPVITDVEVAATILGYLGGCDPDDAVWRARAVLNGAHDYEVRRAICDAIDLDGLRLHPSALRPRVIDLRAQLRAAWQAPEA